MANKENNEETLESLFGQVEEIIEDLEDKDVAIEEAFAKYEAGMKLLEKCNDRIDVIEKNVLKLSAAGSTEAFE